MKSNPSGPPLSSSLEAPRLRAAAVAHPLPLLRQLDPIPIALSTWLDRWIRATLDVLHFAESESVASTQVEDAHRAVALWRYLRHASQSADSSEFPRGVHPALCIAEVRDRERVELESPMGIDGLPMSQWRAIIRVGAPPGTPQSGALLEIRHDDQVEELDLSPTECVVVSASARAFVTGSRAPSRWVAIGLLTGHTIAL